MAKARKYKRTRHSKLDNRNESSMPTAEKILRHLKQNSLNKSREKKMMLLKNHCLEVMLKNKLMKIMINLTRINFHK